MTRLEELKKSLFVGKIMYRYEIRKKLLKIVVLLNCVLFFFSVMNNMPSMVLYILNMYYLYNYLTKEYPEEGFKIKDRFKGMDK